MNFVRCREGHYFDADRYSECPRCERIAYLEMWYGDMSFTAYQHNIIDNLETRFGIENAVFRTEPEPYSDTRADEFVSANEKILKEFLGEYLYWSYKYIQYDWNRNITEEYDAGIYLIDEEKEITGYLTMEFDLYVPFGDREVMYMCIDGITRYLRIYVPFDVRCAVDIGDRERINSIIASLNFYGDLGFFSRAVRNVGMAYIYNYPIMCGLRADELDKVLQICTDDLIDGYRRLMG